MNLMVSRNQKVFLAIVIILPYILSSLAEFDSNRGLIWFWLHQIYYFPLSWSGEAFFIPDSEVGYFVTSLGRVFGLVIYPAIFVAVLFIKRKFYARNTANKSI